MDKKTPEQSADERSRRNYRNVERSAQAAIPNVIGKAVVSLVEGKQQISVDNLIQHLESVLLRSRGTLFESWDQTALQFLKDSVPQK